MAARILIVEDEILVGLEMECILKDLGYECAGIAADLTAAFAYFGDEIDVALVDLNLRDGLTGPQIGTALGASGVSVLFITANPGVLGDGIAGTVGVITKPTDEKTLQKAVEYALGVRRGRLVEAPSRLRLFA